MKCDTGGRQPELYLRGGGVKRAQGALRARTRRLWTLIEAKGVMRDHELSEGVSCMAGVGVERRSS